jgi:hypothetical protein
MMFCGHCVVPFAGLDCPPAWSFDDDWQGGMNDTPR